MKRGQEAGSAGSTFLSQCKMSGLKFKNLKIKQDKVKTYTHIFTNKEARKGRKIN